MKKTFNLSDDQSFSSRDEVRRLQDRLLAEHLRYCRSNSPFYRELFSAFPDRDYDFDSLQELPTTSKRDLAEHNDAFFAVPGSEISVSATAENDGVTLAWISGAYAIRLIGVGDRTKEPTARRRRVISR